MMYTFSTESWFELVCIKLPWQDHFLPLVRPDKNKTNKKIKVE